VDTQKLAGVPFPRQDAAFAPVEECATPNAGDASKFVVRHPQPGDYLFHQIGSIAPRFAFIDRYRLKRREILDPRSPGATRTNQSADLVCGTAVGQLYYG
jgi:hypothetical protein